MIKPLAGWHRLAGFLRPGRPRAGIRTLRRNQRRLLLSGGIVLTAVILSIAALDLVSSAKNTYARHGDIFRSTQQAIGDVLDQRLEGAIGYASINDAMWTLQSERLETDGRTLMEAFHANRNVLGIWPGGDGTMPWLVVGRENLGIPDNRIARYIGLAREYSVLARSTSLFSRYSSGGGIAYEYDPTHALALVAGLKSEAPLAAALDEATPDKVIDRLIRIDQDLRSKAFARTLYERQVYFALAPNPVTSEPSLYTSLPLLDGRNEYLWRVYFEPLVDIESRIREKTRGSFLVLTREGATVLESGDHPAALDKAETASILAKKLWEHPQENSVRESSRQGSLILGGIPGTDWTLVYPVTRAELRASMVARGLRLIQPVSIAVAGIWILLLLLERKVLAPALAEASLVYESEALNRSIIETSPVGLCVIDSVNGNVLVENQWAASMVGTSASRKSALFDFLSSRLARIPDADDTPTPPAILDWQVEETRRLQVIASHARYRERPAWLCVLHDVTAQHEFEEKLQSARRQAERARQAAEEASHAKSSFVASISHEIRTPLYGVLGHLELLSRSTLSEEQRLRLQRIGRSADALLAIISDVLDFSKIEARQLDTVMAPFSLRHLVERAALLFAPEAQQKGLPLYFRIHPALASHYVSDANRLQQILHNLLSNAVKFTESGHIVLRVDPEGSGPEGKGGLRFSVTDTGIGLNEEQQTRLFEPFAQADSSISRRFGGTGLGLALCQELALLLGGSMSVKSTPNKGSSFALHLPEIAPSPSREEGSASLKSMTVALLSDSEEWREEVGSFLASCGASVYPVRQWAELADAALPSDAAIFVVGDLAKHAIPVTEPGANGRRIVVATMDGPLAPQAEKSWVRVSCYASEAWLAALSPGREAAGATDADDGRTSRQYRGRILLVDDHPVNRELIRQQLEVFGLDIDEASGGKAALELWYRNAYDVVFTDLHMPEMNGYEFAERLRQLDAKVPIIGLTASALVSEQEHCREVGMSDVLLKPILLDRLHSVLAKFLMPRQSHTANQAVNRAETAAPSPRPSEAVRVAFVKQAHIDLADMRCAVDAGDEKLLAELIHSFKGVLLMMRETDTAMHCAAAEAELEDEPREAWLHRVSALIAELERVVERYEQLA